MSGSSFQISASMDIPATGLPDIIRASRVLHANLENEADLRERAMEESADAAITFDTLPEPPEDTGL